MPRVDALGHVTGRTQFYADRTFPGMQHLVMVRGPHHHARIRGVDTSAAETMPGVIRILTHADVPKNVYTILCLIQVEPDDEPVLAVDKVRYKGEPVVAVVAEVRRCPRCGRRGQGGLRGTAGGVRRRGGAEAGRAARQRVPRPQLLHLRGPPLPAHPLRRRRQGLSPAPTIVFEEQRYQSSPIEHAPVETTGCIVVPEANGRFTCYTNTQAMYFTLDNAGLILDMPFQKLRMIGGTIGGGFGGKVDVIVEPVAFLAANLTNRPVNFAFSREEEMQVSSPRAAERIYIKDGVMKDGRIVARQIRLYVDAGAYSRHSPYGTTKAAAHMPGPYTIPNVQVDGHCVYTNRTPSSAMRGFGVTIGDFALEVQMDKLARLVGMDPMEFRILNAYRDGDMKATARRPPAPRWSKWCRRRRSCQLADRRGHDGGLHEGGRAEPWRKLADAAWRRSTIRPA